MTRRRSRRGAADVAMWGALAVLAVILADRAGGLVLAIAAAAVCGYGAAWFRYRPRQSRAVARSSPARRQVPGPSGDARARRNGWAPPARGRLVTLAVSPECSGDACAMCPGGDCACRCGHDSRVIAAMNAARADAAPPF